MRLFYEPEGRLRLALEDRCIIEVKPVWASPLSNPGRFLALVDGGLITIIDLTFISKDVDGVVTVVEFDAVEDLAAFAGLDAEIGGILTDEDVAYAVLSLEPGTSAALLVWEDTWAAPFASTVRDANGVILEGARIPHEFVEAAVDALTDALA